MIKGFKGVSLVDYPGKICSVVFVYKCNFRCPYCFNIDLVLPERYRQLKDFSEDWILAEIKKRENFIKGVVITGGEPTLWKEKLILFLNKIKSETKLDIKVDTNGSFPEVLKKIIDEKLVDFVAIDFKTSPEKYALVNGDFKKVESSLNILKNAKDIEWEVRITCYPPFINLDTLKDILPYLKDVKNIALQKYLDKNTLSPYCVPPYSVEEMEKLFSFLKEKLPSVNIVKRF